MSKHRTKRHARIMKHKHRMLRDLTRAMGIALREATERSLVNAFIFGVDVVHVRAGWRAQ